MHKLYIILISIVFLISACTKESEIFSANDPSNTEKNNLSKVIIIPDVITEFEMSGHGDDMPELDELTSYLKTSYKFDFDNGGDDKVTILSFEVPSIKDAQMLESFQKNILEEVRYSEGGLYATFDGVEEIIETDEHFSDAMAFMESEDDAIDQIIANLESGENEVESMASLLSSAEYIMSFADEGYIVTQSSFNPNIYLIEGTVSTPVSTDNIKIITQYDISLNEFIKYETYINDVLMMESSSLYENTNVEISLANIFNPVIQGRNYKSKMTMTIDD